MSSRIATILLVLGLVLSACSGADPGGAATDDEPAPTTAAVTTGGGSGGGSPTADDGGDGTAPDGDSDGDDGPGGVATEQRTDDEDPVAVPFYVQGTLASDEPAGCNQDSVVIQIDGELVVDAGDIVGTGAGEMNFLDRSRCPGTDYGGHETVEAPTVAVIGSVDGDGWTLSFDFDDVTRAYFTDRSEIASGAILDSIVTHSTGTNVDGSIISFHITHEQLDAGEPAYFEVQTPTDTGAWYVGAFGVAWGEDGQNEAFVVGLSEVAAPLL